MLGFSEGSLKARMRGCSALQCSSITTYQSYGSANFYSQAVVLLFSAKSRIHFVRVTVLSRKVLFHRGWDLAVLARPGYIEGASIFSILENTMQFEELLVLLRLLSPELRRMMLRALVLLSQEEEGQRGATGATGAPPAADNPAGNTNPVIIEDWDHVPPTPPRVQDGCPHRCWNCHDFFCSRGQQEHTHHSCSSCNERRRGARRSSRRG